MDTAVCTLVAEELLDQRGTGIVGYTESQQLFINENSSILITMVSAEYQEKNWNESNIILYATRIKRGMNEKLRQQIYCKDDS